MARGDDALYGYFDFTVTQTHAGAGALAGEVDIWAQVMRSISIAQNQHWLWLLRSDARATPAQVTDVTHTVLTMPIFYSTIQLPADAQGLGMFRNELYPAHAFPIPYGTKFRYASTVAAAKDVLHSLSVWAGPARVDPPHLG